MFVKRVLAVCFVSLYLASALGALDISACQSLSSANTVYRLTQAVFIQGATCFSVTAQNVTLQCQGYQLSSNKTTDTTGVSSNQLNTTVDSCVINGFGDGVDFNGAASSTIQHSTLTNHSEAGFLASNAAGIQLTNTTLSSNQDGIKLDVIDDVTFSLLNVSSNSRYGFFFNDSIGNQIYNSTFSGSGTYDLFSDQASSNTFVNTTFNRSHVGWNDGAASNITVKWYFRVLAQNATGGAISSASVNVTNASSGTPQYQLTSDSSGLTSINEATEYVQNGAQVYGANQTNHTPHNVTGRIAGYYFVGSSVQNSTNVTVRSSQTFTLVLAGNWALIKGTLRGRKIINTSENGQFLSESNASPYGHVLVIPQDGSLNYSALTALTRNTANGFESTDFADADALLNLTGEVDSIAQVFGGGGTSPSQTDTFTLAGYARTQVPVVNSTNSTNFVTGLLWHSQAVNNYTQSAKPTLTLVTRVNRQAQGKYGVYDYEIRVPATLDAFHGGTVVELYGELQ